MAETSQETVNKFFAAWSRLNLNELMGFFTEDAEYQNIHAGGRMVTIGSVTADRTGVPGAWAPVCYLWC